MELGSAYATLVDLMSSDKRFKRAIAEGTGAEYAVASLRGRVGFDCEVGIVTVDTSKAGFDDLLTQDEHALLIQIESRPLPFETSGEKLDAFFEFKRLSFAEQDVMLVRKPEIFSEVFVLSRTLSAHVTSKVSVISTAEQLVQLMDELESDLAKNFKFEFDRW